MKIATVKLKSVSPYSPSRFHDSPKLEKEGHDKHEERTWRERCHYDPKTREVFIPPMAFKWAVSEAARFLGLKIPGKGNKTWAKHFDSGILVTDPVRLGVKVDDVRGEWLFLNADGRRGSGTRVKRCMPHVDEWESTVKFYVIDDTIEPEVFVRHLREAGNFVGVGRFRPRNGGFLGRFEIVDVKWQEAA